MICKTCVISKPLSLCEGRYTIGNVTDTESEVKVRIKNLATGRIDYINTITTDTGDVVIEYIPMNHQYEINVFNSDGEPYSFTIEGVETECIRVQFEISHLTAIQ